MFNDQLNFNRTEAPNYFIFNNGSQHMIRNNNNYIEDLHSTKLVPCSLANEQKQIHLTHDEYLDYKSQKEENILPKEKPNPLYFNESVHKATYQTKINNIMKQGNKRACFKIKQSNKKRQIPNSKKNKTQKKNFTINKITNNKTFDLNTNINSKGLFDPGLKRNELDGPATIQKQRNERLAKIDEYENKFGKKVKNLEEYRNYLEVFEDAENKKNEMDLKRKIYENYKSSNTDGLRKILATIPKPMVKYSQCNLDFNFSKYEEMIKSLEEQISHQRKLRDEDDRKYHEMIREHKRTNQFQSRASKRSTMNNRRKSNNRMNHANRKRPQSSNMRYINRPGTDEDRLKSQTRDIAHSNEKINNRDFDGICRDVSIKESQVKRNYYAGGTKRSKSQNRYSKKGGQYTRPPISSSNTHSNNMTLVRENKNQASIQSSYYQQKDLYPNTSIENQIMNEVVNYDYINNADQMNKFQLLANVNNSIENYAKNFPKIVNQVNEVVSKITKVNVLDDQTHPIIKIASKSAGQIIHQNMDEIIKRMIDDILLEIVNDLQSIEESKEKKSDKSQFVNFVSGYYTNIQQIRSLENDVMKKITSRESMSLSMKDKEILRSGKGDNNSLTKLDICGTIDMINRKIPRVYHTAISNKIIGNAEKYAKSYYEYLKLKGTFYYHNIFGLYDEVINEQMNKILKEEIDYCLKQVDEFVSDLYKEEVLK